jgi:hypothetical protein
MHTGAGEHPAICRRNSFPKNLNKNSDAIEESFGYAMAIRMNISLVFFFFWHFYELSLPLRCTTSVLPSAN